MSLTWFPRRFRDANSATIWELWSGQSSTQRVAWLRENGLIVYAMLLTTSHLYRSYTGISISS